MSEIRCAPGLRVHTPCGPRKSGMPLSVEIPAPVSTVTADDCRTHPATVVTSPRDTDTAPDATGETRTVLPAARFGVGGPGIGSAADDSRTEGQRATTIRNRA